MIQPAPVERVLRARDHVAPLEDVGGQRLSHDVGDRVLGKEMEMYLNEGAIYLPIRTFFSLM